MSYKIIWTPILTRCSVIKLYHFDKENISVISVCSNAIEFYYGSTPRKIRIGVQLNSDGEWFMDYFHIENALDNHTILICSNFRYWLKNNIGLRKNFDIWIEECL